MNLPKMIMKRDGSSVVFDEAKILNAVSKAIDETKEVEQGVANAVLVAVLDKIKERNDYDTLDVESVQDLVEDALIELKLTRTAKAYILYREKRTQERKPDLFKKRLAFKPYEYPELAAYQEAIQHSYWLHSEYNYTSDIQDFKVNSTDVERNAIKNAMLAIAQVEVAVKTFWGDLYHRMPKPELGSVGATFSESEARHSDAYSHLLEILGLNGEFEKIKDIPALMQRVSYLDKATASARTGDDRDYTLAILLFSLFTEHVSLFSQFLIIMSFNKYKQQFKGISNAIEATSKEEEIHGLFGIEIINIIREEHPEWFDKDLEEQVYASCKYAWESEEIVIDWIYEAGDLDFMPKRIVKEFVKNRLNNSLVSVGYEKMFEVDEQAVIDTDWFTEEVITTKHVDFLNKRSVNYTKRSSSMTGDDLF